MNQCGDINYFNLKSATLWSSPNILHRASGVYGKVVNWVSCQLPMWRYATLPIWNEICRKLLFNNFSIVWPIEIILITFCQEGPQMLCGKFHANRWNCLGGVRKRDIGGFGVCSGSEKCYHFGEKIKKWIKKIILRKTIGSLQIPCLGPNNNHWKNNRDLAGK